MHKKRRVVRFTVSETRAEGTRKRSDSVVVEEPLTIVWQAQDGPVQRLAATMRTPGEDNELAAGLLFAEGLIRSRGELELMTFCASGEPNELNRLRARLRLSAAEAEARWMHRPSTATPQSSCGMCSYEELNSPSALVDWAARVRPSQRPGLLPDDALLEQAQRYLAQEMPVFARTGASHGCIVVDAQGTLLAAAEDVGRHNACDKAIGTLLLAATKSGEPFMLAPGCGVLFSSRLSFELAAKAVRAGAAWIAAIGAPTHLAVELAQKVGIPLLGFVSEHRYNAYSQV